MGIKLVFFDGGHGKDKGVWPTETVVSPATITAKVPGRPGRGLYAWRVTTAAGKTAYRRINGFGEAIATAHKLYVVWDFKIVALPSVTTVVLALQAVTGSTVIGYLYLTPIGTMQWKLLDDNSVLQTVATSAALDLNRWYEIEPYYQRASGVDANDGGGHLKIDQAMIDSRYDVDIFVDRQALGILSLGCPAAAQNSYIADYANVYVWLTPPQHETIGDPAVTGQGGGVFRVANFHGQVG